MLEVPRADTIDDWSEERIWAELQQRLHADREPKLAQGPCVERDVLDLRVRVIEPMHDRRLYLTGDAAHLITPAGGKGMNLAIQDAVELGLSVAGALRSRSRRDTSSRLLGQATPGHLAHAGVLQLDADPAPRRHEPVGRPSEFAHRLRRARLLELIGNPPLSRWFAHTYAGVDHNTPRRRQGGPPSGARVTSMRRRRSASPAPGRRYSPIRFSRSERRASRPACEDRMTRTLPRVDLALADGWDEQAFDGATSSYCSATCFWVACSTRT